MSTIDAQGNLHDDKGRYADKPAKPQAAGISLPSAEDEAAEERARIREIGLAAGLSERGAASLASLGHILDDDELREAASRAYGGDFTSNYYLHYDSQLDDEEANDLLRGEWDAGDTWMDRAGEALREQDVQEAQRLFAGAYDELDEEDRDELVDFVREHRISPLRDLARNHGRDLVQYAPGDSARSLADALYADDEVNDPDEEKALAARERVLRGELEKAGLDMSVPENQEALGQMMSESPFGGEKFISPESYDLRILNHADLDEIALHGIYAPDGVAPGEDGYARTVVTTNPSIWLRNRDQGSGWEAEFKGEVRSKLGGGNLPCIDAVGDGAWTAHDVIGPYKPAFAAEVRTEGWEAR